MRIKDFSEIRMGHAFRQRLVRVPDGNVLVIQPKNITLDGSISFREGTPLRIKTPAAKPLQPKDVLVVNRGRFAAAVFDLSTSERWIVPSSILVLSINTRSILPEYVTCYFNSADGQRLFQRHCEQTTIPFISTANLKNMDIPIPPIERQRSLVAYDSAVTQYARLASRKQELYGLILNRELMLEEHSIKRSVQ
jgi:restriction endonuclease S subunit